MLKVNKTRQDHLPAVVEYLVIVAIVLVIVYTILEELAIIYHWSHETMVALVWVGFFFDLFFTVEFVARSIATGRHGHFSYYFLHQRGWIDFFTSIPLLVLVSGPAVYLLLQSSDDFGEIGALAAVLHVLKTAKAIRVTRILRLIRVIKLFGKIQNTESTMTNRHVATISTMVVVTLIAVLMFSQFVPFLHIGNREDFLRERKTAMRELFTGHVGQAPDEIWIKDYISDNEVYADIIRIKTPEDEILYESPYVDELSWTAYNGWSHVNGKYFEIDNGYKYQLSYHNADSEHAKLNLFILFVIVAVIMTMMLLYTRMFAQQVADPIYIMDKGLRQWEYNLEVRIDDNYPDDEVMHMARAYNNRWLTLKNQIRAYRRKKEGEAGEKSALSLDDVL
ncbi:MAG: ion transporter [Leptospiraceae bacterium]|nr:ion transporter [Leptospiraceae bacterium]MCB1316211.1 ion transporter [Leptospiraceae bacterium]